MRPPAGAFFLDKNPISVVRPPAGAFFSGKMTFLDVCSYIFVPVGTIVANAVKEALIKTGRR